MSPRPWQEPPSHKRSSSRMPLEDGDRVAVMGGGPAGSFFASSLLDLAEISGMSLSVDVYEPREFHSCGAKGCNMCGGIISETLVQNLAIDGIPLPDTVVQRGIDSYVMHMDDRAVRIATPFEEKRIGTVHRGAGPRDLENPVWTSFDGHLQDQSRKRGATIHQERVTGVTRENGRIRLTTKSGREESYELLVVATGVNSTAYKIFEELKLEYRAPVSVKTAIREYRLGAEVIDQHLGAAMHVFLLDLPGLEFAAMIPKGEYVTMCLLGEEIDKPLLDRFLASPEVRSCMPADWVPDEFSCTCSPSMPIESAVLGSADRIVFIGDIGVSRLYKDGIGAAYRTAKAAARAAIFHGVSGEQLRRNYHPVCRGIERDNRVGKLIFWVTRVIQRSWLARAAVLRCVVDEQREGGPPPRMSSVLWDMFTGSADYREILLRTLHPVFLARLARSVVLALPAAMRGGNTPEETIQAER